MSKSKNPLYVVSKNGVDVEAANNIVEMLLKKLNLDALIPVLNAIVDTLFQSVTSYPIFIEVKKVFDRIFEQIINLLFELQMKFTKK